MILTAAFIISKALGASWSWWWLLLTIICDWDPEKPIIKIEKRE
mgnify:CR=1 FL=1